MAGVNKVIIVADYSSGMSLPQVAGKHGVSISSARKYVLEAGALRSRADGVRMAASAGLLGSAWRGRNRTFTQEHCDAISHGRKLWGDKNAAGVSKKPNGYIEITRGPNKWKSVHVLKMELRIGRALLPDECVHHIDGDKENNNDNNLALVTRSGHMRLHCRERSISKQAKG